MDQSLLKTFGEFASSLDWSAWVTATATLVLTFLTFVYVRLTKAILEAQSDPCVVLTVVHEDAHPTIIQLVAKNIGTGLANDIRFEFNHAIPEKAFGITKREATGVRLMKHGPLINGIPALAPGEVRKMYWGQYGGLKDALNGKDIVATCRFRKGKKEMPAMQCPLDIESFFNTVAAEPPVLTAAKSLSEISKDLRAIAKGYHKIKIEVVAIPESDEKTEV
jgi:hypothetical protein